MSTDFFLPIIGAALLLAGFLMLILLVTNILRSARLGDRERRFRSLIWASDLKRGLVVVIALASIGLANLTFWLNGELRLYAPVAPNLPLGMVSVLQMEESLPRLVYSTSDEAGREAFEVFPVRDATFRLYGERIRWSKPLAALGLNEVFKVTRIEFMPPQEQRALSNPTYRIEVGQGSSALYGYLSRFGRWFPFISADSMSTPAYDARGEFAMDLLLDSTGLVLR